MSSLHKCSNFDHGPETGEVLQQLRKSEFHKSLHPAEATPVRFSPAKELRLLNSDQNSRKRHSSRYVMEVANTIIDLGDCDDTSEDSEGSWDNDSEINLNATFSSKLGHRKYSKILEAINEAEIGSNVEDELDQFMSNLDIGSSKATTSTSHKSNIKSKNLHHHKHSTNIPCTLANGHYKSKKRLCEVRSMDGLSF